MNLIYAIGKEYHFEAAHRLPNHQGKCARPHGHSYRFEVELRGAGVCDVAGHSDEGMVVDYNYMDAAIMPIVEELDHHDLNQVFWIDQPPTAEHIAASLFRRIQGSTPTMWGDTLARVVRVRVHETAKTWAEVRT